MSKRDEWQYVNAETADMARAILGVPPDTVVEQYCARNPDLPPCWAVKVPKEESRLAVATEIARAAVEAASATWAADKATWAASRAAQVAARAADKVVDVATQVAFTKISVAADAARDIAAAKEKSQPAKACDCSACRFDRDHHNNQEN